MIDTMLYIGCGLAAGFLGGFLGIGGGVLAVPYLVMLTGMNIKQAVPISVAAILVNSISASTAYLARGMVHFEFVVLLSLFMMVGSVVGSSFSWAIPALPTTLMFSAVLLYSAWSMLRKKKTDQTWQSQTITPGRWVTMAVTSFLTGALAAIVGIGGGVVLVPLMYLIFHVSMSHARGTSTLVTGFSAAAALVVYLARDEVLLAPAAAVVVGMMLGGRLGGYLGAKSKPRLVQYFFAAILLYLAVQLAYKPVRGMM